MLDETQPLKGRFSAPAANTSAKSRIGDRGAPPQSKSSPFFALENGKKFVRRFKVYLRDGQVVSMPYAYLPLFVFDPEGVLTIRTGEITLEISGRALNKLTDWFNEERVLWIKESPSGVDDTGHEVFISDIEIKMNEGDP